jgi:voltage-gated potassium channel
MLVLSVVWLALFVVELTRGLSPFLETVGYVIWAVFVLDFALRFTLAPAKGRFLARNALTAVSLVLPALRVFRAARVLRFLRAGRAVRGVRLVKSLGSLNRGIRIARVAVRRRGLGYVVGLSGLVLTLGAAAMYGLEAGEGWGAFEGYGASIWWVGRVLMTIGPEAWPVTPEGRVLALLLALYGYAVFGYVTASIASVLMGRDNAGTDDEAPSLAELRDEIRALRAELARRDVVTEKHKA